MVMKLSEKAKLPQRRLANKAIFIMRNNVIREKITDFNMEITSVYGNKISTWKGNRHHIYVDTLTALEKTNNNILKLF